MSPNITLESTHEIKISREFRDPVYNYIHVTDIENEVIDSSIFQRLDRISQMTTAHFVYPSGEYSRKTHSLGTMFLTNKAILHILYLHSKRLRQRISPLLFGESVVTKEGRDTNIDPLDQQKYNDWWDSKNLEEIIQYSRLAALLHDIGHAPFSHTFEDSTRELKRDGIIREEFDHEKMSMKIIIEKEKDLKLRDFEGNEIVEILNKEGSAPKFLKELINGPCDCDKLDYLMRDSHHIGAPEYGSIDADRIIDGFRVYKQKLCISSSALHAVMNSFRAVQSMYTAIYFHRASRVFDFMILDALREIPDFMVEIVSSVDEFLRYDDYSLVCAINEKAKGEDSSAKPYKKAKRILKKVRNREKTYKHILEFPLSLPLVISKVAKDKLEGIERRIREHVEDIKASDFNIKYDYRSDIRPIGIKLEDIINWLLTRRIYDTTDNEVKRLKDIYEAYFRDLKRYSILFRIFADREKCDKHHAKVKKISKKAREELKKLEIEFSELS